MAKQTRLTEVVPEAGALSSESCGLSFGPRRKLLPSAIERHAHSFLDMLDLFSLFCSSRGLGALVARTLAVTKTISVELTHYAAHESAFGLVARHCRSLQRIDVARHENTDQKKNEEETKTSERWLLALIRNNLATLRAVNDDRATQQALSALSQCTNLEECCFPDHVAIGAGDEHIKLIDALQHRAANLRKLRFPVRYMRYTPYDGLVDDGFGAAALSFLASGKLKDLLLVRCVPDLFCIGSGQFRCLTNLQLSNIVDLAECFTSLNNESLRGLRRLAVQLCRYRDANFGEAFGGMKILHHALLGMRELEELVIDNDIEHSPVHGEWANAQQITQWCAAEWRLPTLRRLQLSTHDVPLLPRIVASELRAVAFAAPLRAILDAVDWFLQPSVEEFSVRETHGNGPRRPPAIADRARATSEKLFMAVASGFPNLRSLALDIPGQFLSPLFCQAFLQRPRLELTDLSLRLPKNTAAEDVLATVCHLRHLQSITITVDQLTASKSARAKNAEAVASFH